MGRGQNNRAACYWVRLSVLGSAPLAAVLCSVVPHKPASQFPICRVACFVLGPYRHSRSNPALKATRRCAARALALRWASMGYRRRYHAGHPLLPLSLDFRYQPLRPCQSQPSTHSQRHRECRIYQAIQLRFGALHHQPNPGISVVKFRTSVPPFTPNHSLVRTGLYGAWLLSWSWSCESFIQLLGGILIGVKLRTEFCHRTIPFLASFKRFARPEFYLRVIYPFNRSPLQGIFFGC